MPMQSNEQDGYHLLKTKLRQSCEIRARDCQGTACDQYQANPSIGYQVGGHREVLPRPLFDKHTPSKQFGQAPATSCRCRQQPASLRHQSGLSTGASLRMAMPCNSSSSRRAAAQIRPKFVRPNTTSLRLLHSAETPFCMSLCGPSHKCRKHLPTRNLPATFLFRARLSQASTCRIVSRTSLLAARTRTRTWLRPFAGVTSKC